MASSADSSSQARREIGKKLCHNMGYYRACGKCEYNIYSQRLLRLLTFRELIGIMSSLLMPTIDASGTPDYAHCLLLCNSNTVTIHKVIDTQVKMVCDTTLCKFIATEWLGYNGVRSINTNSVRSLMNIIENSTTTEGLVDALCILYSDYNIWDMNDGTAAYAASCTQDGNHYRDPGISNYQR